jgi:hypothetical protein
MKKRTLLKLKIKHFTKLRRHYSSSNNRTTLADILQYNLQVAIDFSWLDFVVESNVSDKFVEKDERHTLSYMCVPPISSRF